MYFIRLTNGAEKESGMMFDESQSNLHFDIDHTLNDKAKKNKLSKTNVKNLIKVSTQTFLIRIYSIYNLLSF